MKRNVGKLCTILLALCMVIITASARYSTISYLNANLSVSGSGYASCSGTCNVEYGYTAEVTLELQQKNGTTWKTIMDWSDSGRRVSFDKGQFISRGYDYRLKISADIYDSDGDLVEDATSYSTIESF